METATKVTDKVEVQVTKPVTQTKPVSQVVTRKLLVPQTKKPTSRVVTVNGVTTKLDGETITIPNLTPKIKVVDTFEDKTTKIWERDFELSTRLIANDINLRR